MCAKVQFLTTSSHYFISDERVLFGSSIVGISWIPAEKIVSSKTAIKGGHDIYHNVNSTGSKQR